VALLVDFLFLPPLLMFLDRKKNKEPVQPEEPISLEERAPSL
jgi:hypothetical protein